MKFAQWLENLDACLMAGAFIFLTLGSLCAVVGAWVHFVMRG